MKKKLHLRAGSAFLRLGLFHLFSRHTHSVVLSKPKLLIENLTLIVAATARLSIFPEAFLSRTTTEVTHEKRKYGLRADRGGNLSFHA
jgi:hypothetical protein